MFWIIGGRKLTWDHMVVSRLDYGRNYTAKYMHKIFEAVTDLEPLSPSATPGTTKHFKDATDAFQQYTNLIAVSPFWYS